jgi:hypothetical protein
MSKTLTQLITEATSLTDETYDNVQWVDWFNNCLDDLSPYLYLDDIATINEDTEGSGIFTIPETYLSMIRVDGTNKDIPMLEPGDDDSIGYKLRGTKLYKQNDVSTTITCTFYRRPAYLTTLDSSAEVDIPAGCNRALIYFAGAQAMMLEDETERFNVFSDQYEKAKAAVQSMNKHRKPAKTGQWGVVR